MQLRPFFFGFIFAISCGGPAKPPAPFQSGSPWPKFRGNLTQDALGTITPQVTSVQFHSYRTGKGIFSSPVVAADGTIYVGSADRTFYAFAPDLSIRWSLITGEIIDSAGLLDDAGRVYFGSGDGVLRALDAATGKPAWTFSADPPGGMENPRSLINWFEGNVALSPAGQLFVPNDNFIVYQLDRSTGKVTGRIDMPDQTWSLPAFDAHNNQLYIGNNNVAFGSNVFAYSLNNLSSSVWDNYSPGSIAASPMVTPSGKMIVGGFDGFVRAYDANGAQLWQFGARDHIYASPARLPDGTVVQAATDGAVYGLDEQSGALRWEFDTRDPIRSSPAVDAAGNVYFGSGDGRLYVLNKDGTLRWSVQLISESRNNVNASPALGKDAVYIAGESGEVFSVPYDYCLRADGKADPRCAPPAAPTLPSDGAVLLFTTNFGAELPAPPTGLDPNEPIVLSLVVRKGGSDQLALLDSSNVQVTLDPPSNSATTTVAGNGKFLTIVPNLPFAPAADGKFGVTVSAGYLINPARSGLKLSGGTASGPAQIQFRAQPTAANNAPFGIVTPGAVWEISRLSLPLPTLLPSYNQIGFDSLHYLVSTIDTVHGHTIAWMAGAKLATGVNQTVIDPATRALAPLVVDYAGGFVTFSNHDGLSVEVTNAVIPLHDFRASTMLGSDGNSASSLHIIGSTVCANIALYGLFLERLGLCNPTTDLLVVSGASNFKLYQGYTPPASGDVGTVTFANTADTVTATVSGSKLKLADHIAAVMLVDTATGLPVSLSYGLTTQRTADASGMLATVTLPVTKSAASGKTVKAYLIVDMSPVATSQTLSIPAP